MKKLSKEESLKVTRMYMIKYANEYLLSSMDKISYKRSAIYDFYILALKESSTKNELKSNFKKYCKIEFGDYSFTKNAIYVELLDFINDKAMFGNYRHEAYQEYLDLIKEYETI